MVTYFQYARTPPDQWLNGIIAQIHSQHFAEKKGTDTSLIRYLEPELLHYSVKRIYDKL